MEADRHRSASPGDDLNTAAGTHGKEHEPRRSFSRHPTLELRHTTEDRLMVASAVNYLPLRAFFHRNRDTIVCMSEIIKEVSGSGEAREDRILVITDKHVYVTKHAAMAVFAPAAAGSFFSMRDFVRIVAIAETQHCLLQFVGATICMRFSTSKDVGICSRVIYSLTGSPAEHMSIADLGSIHGRSVLGAPNSLARAMMMPTNNIVAAPSGRGAAEVAKSESMDDDGAAHPTTQAGSVDNIMRYILDEAKSGAYDSLFRPVAVQAAPQIEDSETQASPPPTRDASTSPLAKRELSRHRPASQAALREARFGDDAPGLRDESETVSSDQTSDFDPNLMWRSLSRAPEEGGSRRSQTPPPSSHTGTRKIALDLDTWLGGALLPYKQALKARNLDSVAKFAKMNREDLEAAMDAAGMLQMGHRALLTAKVHALRPKHT